MGVSGNSVAGKSFQMFTVSEELLQKVVEAVQAGEKEARSSGVIQSFEVFCHGFRQNISLGRIYVVPASVCSDRKNFPTALLHGALIRVFGTGGEEISDLIEKKIGESEFDEYSQADFDAIKKDLFVNPRDGKEACLIVFAPNWMNTREWITFHFTKDSNQLKNNLRHQVFSAYYDPRVSSAFNAMMTNVNTTKVDVTDITPKIPFPFLAENLLKQYPDLQKQASNKGKILLNYKTADAVTKETLDPQELDVFDSLNQALENSLMPGVAEAGEAEGGFKAPMDGGVPRAAAKKDKKVSECEKCKAKIYGASLSQKLCNKCENPKDKKGSDERPLAAHEAPFTNVGPGTEAAAAQESMVKAVNEVVETEKENELTGSPIGIAIDETGVPRREDAKVASASAELKKKLHPARFKGISGKMAAIVGFILGETYTNPAISEMAITSDGMVMAAHVGEVGMNDFIGAESDLRRNWSSLLDVAGLDDKEKKEANALYRKRIRSFQSGHNGSKKAGNPSNRMHDVSHPETLCVGQERLSSSYSAAYNGGFVDKHAMPPKEVRSYMEKHMGNNDDYAPHATADHAKQIEAGAYGDDPLSRRSQEKWGSAKVAATYTTGDKFLLSYIETALWSTNDNATPSGGDPLDKNYGRKDLAASTMAAMSRDCHKFEDDNRELLDRAYSEDGQNTAVQGHDFWLTRNGHGSGFWDGDYPATGDALTAAAKQFREVDLYIGDDGLIYQSGDENLADGAPGGIIAARVASAMAKIVDSDGGYEAMSSKAKKARTKKESMLDKFRSKEAVALDIDSIWSEITEDFGPAPVVDVDSSDPSQNDKSESSGGGRPNKRDVSELPEAMRSDKPEEAKAISDSEAESQETDLENSATKSEEHHEKESSWRLDPIFADFVQDVANDYEESEDEGKSLSCDQCNMLSIQGVPCHETGCPNMSARWDEESQNWVKQRECRECGMTVDADDPCCNAPFEDDEDGPATFGEAEEFEEHDAAVEKEAEALHPKVQARQKVERTIATSVVKALLSAGFSISVDNGAYEEGEISSSTDEAAILKSMFLTDEERLYAEKGGKKVGWVYFIYGEDGWDVINDYTVNLEQYIGEGTETQTLIDKFMNSHTGSAKTAEWKEWNEQMPVQVVGHRDFEEFANLAEAKKKYPTLDPSKNTKDFTWAMYGEIDGKPAIRFETWPANRMYSASVKKKANPLQPDAAEAKAETVSPDTVDKDIQQPTVSVEDAAKKHAAEEPTAGEDEGFNVKVTYKKGGITLSPTSNLLEDVQGLGETINKPSIYDLMEDFFSNGWETVRPEDIGALTSGEIFADANGNIYWHERYQIEDMVEELMNGNSVFMQYGGNLFEETPEEPYKDPNQMELPLSASEKTASWMNEYDVDLAVQHYAENPHAAAKYPERAKAARFLKEFMEEVNSHSDGWAYWRLPANAAKQLMDLLQMANQEPEIVTEQSFRKALGPIKSFMTRRGLAAGMQMPKIGADISGDIAEAKSELDYNKAEIADDAVATDTVNPEHFAAAGDEFFEELPFDFGAGDLADIVVTEDGTDE